MILSFGNKETADIYHGHANARTRRYPKELLRVALRKLDMLWISAHRRGIAWKPSAGTSRDFTASGSMISGASYSDGPAATHETSG